MRRALLALVVTLAACHDHTAPTPPIIRSVEASFSSCTPTTACNVYVRGDNLSGGRVLGDGKDLGGRDADSGSLVFTQPAGKGTILITVATTAGTSNAVPYTLR